MQKKPILVVGSLAFDTIGTVRGRAREILGGSAVHFSLAASVLAPVKLVGVVGKDFSKQHRALLSSRGVDISGLEVMDGNTFRWVGEYDKDFNSARTICTKLNVFEKFSPKLGEQHKAAKSVFLANIDPELQLGVLEQVRRPDYSACDTMNLWINHKKASLTRLLSRVDISFMNEDELRLYSGEYNLIKAARQAMKKGPSVMVVKRGSNGAMLFCGGSCVSLPAFPVENVVDPTGAGDSFAGGFMGYLASTSGKPDMRKLKTAMAYGTVVSSFNVQGFGIAATAKLRKPELCKRFKEYTGALKIS
ncbi:MAG: sugar kinase [Elusimicrobia bacterium]|nr:sugar kinase [Elusimicrobiota bacterium]